MCDMKAILHRQLFWLLVVLMGISSQEVNAQGEAQKKFSTTTKIFLEGIGKPENVQSKQLKDGTTLVADTKDVAGVRMIQAFIHLYADNYAALESLGVRIDAKFNKLVTAMIPVDKMQMVASLWFVKQVNVAKKLDLLTDKMRMKTHALDAITYSEYARKLNNLQQAYQGTDVILGMIDTGIQFDHDMFKSQNGYSRIWKAMVYDPSTASMRDYSEGEVMGFGYDDTSENHGSHTSSIAGGSDYDFEGYNFDGQQFTQETFHFGGMAPDASLVLCGLRGELTDANIAACIQGISDYADAVGKPCVINVSMGGQLGAHDGSDALAEVCRQYSDRGKVIVFAAGNDAEMDAQGGVYLWGTATSPASPLLSVVCQPSDELSYNSGKFISYHYNTSNMLANWTTDTWARKANVPLGARVYVVNTKTNEVVWVSKDMTTDTKINADTEGAKGGLFGSYFASIPTGLAHVEQSGSVFVYVGQDAVNGKYNVLVRPYYCWSRGFDQMSVGSIYDQKGYYQIGVAYFPLSEGEGTVIDSWVVKGDALYTHVDATLDGQPMAFTAGSDSCSVTNEACSPDVISVGAYVGNRSWVGADGYGYAYTNETLSPMDGMIYFSGYQADGYGPTQRRLPTVSAPGVCVVAAYNRGRFDDADYNDDNESANYIFGYDDQNPIGAMSGTSMSAPCVAGIVAEWLEADATLSSDDIKEVIRLTSRHDAFTDAEGEQRFGANGKIDAVEGLRYITTYQLDELQTNADGMYGLISKDKRYVSFPRKMPTKWNSICLPFDVTLSEIDAVKAMEFVGTEVVKDGVSVNFNSVTTLRANVPYLVYFNRSVDGFEFYEKEVLPSDEMVLPDPINGAYSMVGSYVYYDNDELKSPIKYGDYVVGERGLVMATGENKIRAFRCYLRAEEPAINSAALRIKSINFDGELLTGLEAVQVDELLGGQIYNLRGQRLGQPHQGVNVVKGRKFVVK